MPKTDRLGRPNHGFSVINSDRVAEHDTSLRLNIPKYLDEALTKHAKRTGKSKAELVRTYCTWGLENDKR